MKIKKYRILKTKTGVGLYGRNDKNKLIPLVYFRKPKWIDEQSYLEVVKSIRMKWFYNCAIKKAEGKK